MTRRATIALIILHVQQEVSQMVEALWAEEALVEVVSLEVHEVDDVSIPIQLFIKA